MELTIDEKKIVINALSQTLVRVADAPQIFTIINKITKQIESETAKADRTRSNRTENK